MVATVFADSLIFTPWPTTKYGQVKVKLLFSFPDNNGTPLGKPARIAPRGAAVLPIYFIAL
jgi:hypothetical protein